MYDVGRIVAPSRVFTALAVAGGMLVATSSANALGGIPTPTIPPVLPTISGSLVQGSTLSCSTGGWQNATSYTYKWLANGSTDAGPAASAQYTLTASDVGKFIRCSVTAYDGSTASATPQSSAPAGPVSAPLPGAPANESPPVISGTAQAGQTVSCSQGAWLNATAYAISWLRDLTTQVGSGSTYTLTANDVNHAITCVVTASNSSGSAQAISAPITPLSPPVPLAPVNTAAPSILGNSQEGQTVSCSPGTWLGSPTSYSYSWQRNAGTIAGATSSQYTLAAADVNAGVTCTVVAHNASGDSLPAVSLPVVPTQAGSGGTGGNGGGTGGTGGSGGGTGGNGGGTGGGHNGGGTKLHVPTIQAFSVNPRSVLVMVKGKAESTKGATFNYKLDQKAGVLIEVQQRLAGRVGGKGCVAQTKRNKKAKSCIRWVTIKTLAVKSAKAGSNQLKYNGKVGSKLFASGAYRAYAAAVNTTGWSKLRSANFSVKRKKVAVKKRHRKPAKHRRGAKH
jgi:hypothetical protein